MKGGTERCIARLLLTHVLYKIINKMYVNMEIAHNDTDLSCCQLDINDSKCCAFVNHFETLRSSLIQDKSRSFSAISVFTHILFIILYRTYKRNLNFHRITIKLFL